MIPLEEFHRWLEQLETDEQSSFCRGFVIHRMRNFDVQWDAIQPHYDDACQEAKIKAIQAYSNNPGLFQNRDHLRYCICINTMRELVNIHRRQSTFLKNRDEIMLRRIFPRTEWTEEDFARLRIIVEELGEAERTLLDLRFVEGLTLDEMAGALFPGTSLSPSGSRSKVWKPLQKVLHRLRQRLLEGGLGPPGWEGQHVA